MSMVVRVYTIIITSIEKYKFLFVEINDYTWPYGYCDTGLLWREGAQPEF